MCKNFQPVSVSISPLPLCFSFFFLMIRRPPRSTLFPTRRSSDLIVVSGIRAEEKTPVTKTDIDKPVIEKDYYGQDIRSEEHTSELQSPCNLVCRLLLEKKKTTQECLGGVPVSLILELDGPVSHEP